MLKGTLSIVAALVATGSLAGPSFATTVGTPSNGTFVVSNNDLIEGLSPVVTGNISDAEGLNANTTGSILTNGTFGPAGLTDNPGPNPEMTIIHNGATLTYTLPANTLGYNITDINTFTGWRDGGRVDQNYDVLVTTVSNPVFTSVLSVGQSAGGQRSLQVLTSGLGLTDVTAIRFSFPSVQNGFVGYRELDVIGTAIVVPEPASLGLLAVGGLALVRRRRA